MNAVRTFNLIKLPIIIATLSYCALLLSTPVYAERLKATGKISMLRVHDVGTKYGPPNDQIDGEVVVKMDNLSGKAFGFKLRNDDNRYAHQGMLDLLRDAFNYNHTTTIVYDICSGSPCNNGTIVRIWLTK